MGGSASTPTEDALRRALFRRMSARLKAAVRGATGEQLLEAVEAPTAAETIARLLSAAPGEAGDAGGWTEELLRGAARKQELLEAAGGTLTTGQVARLLDVSVPAVQQRVRRSGLLALPLNNGEWGFPAVQFTERGVPAGLRRVLRAFREADPWVQLSILLSDDYGDGRIVDWIREGRRLDDAERIARSCGQQGAD